MLWIHNSCSCSDGEVRPIDGRTMIEVDVDGTMLDMGHVLLPRRCAVLRWGCDSAIPARYCITRGESRKLLPALIPRHLSRRIHGNVYEACVCSAMLYGSETRGPNNFELQWLRRMDRAMTRFISGIKENGIRLLYYYRNLPLMVLRQSYAVGDSDCLAM